MRYLYEYRVNPLPAGGAGGAAPMRPFAMPATSAMVGAAQVIAARDQLLHDVHGWPAIPGGGAAAIPAVAPLPVPAGAAAIKALSEQEADFMSRVSQFNNLISVATLLYVSNKK